MPVHLLLVRCEHPVGEACLDARHSPRVAYLGEETQALAIAVVGDLPVALLVCGSGEDTKRSRPQSDRGGGGALEESWGSGNSLARRVRAPEVLEGDDELQPEQRVGGFRPVESGTQVVTLGEGRTLIARAVVVLAQMRLARDPEHALGVAAADVVGFARPHEPLARELADRLEHPEALFAEEADAPADEALVQQRSERFEVCVADGLGGFERATAAKDGQPAKEALLVLVEQIVGPRNRRAQGRVALVGVTRALEQVEALAEPCEERCRAEELRARGRKFEREREPIETRAQLGDGGIGFVGRAARRARARRRA